MSVFEMRFTCLSVCPRIHCCVPALATATWPQWSTARKSSWMAFTVATSTRVTGVLYRRLVPSTLQRQNHRLASPDSTGSTQQKVCLCTECLETVASQYGCHQSCHCGMQEISPDVTLELMFHERLLGNFCSKFLMTGIYSEVSHSATYNLTQRIYAHRTITRLLVVEVDLERLDTALPLKLKVELNRWKVSEDVTFTSEESGLDEVR